MTHWKRLKLHNTGPFICLMFILSSLLLSLNCTSTGFFNTDILNFFEHPELPVSQSSSILLYEPVSANNAPIDTIKQYLYNLLRQRLLYLKLTDNLMTISDDQLNRHFLSAPQHLSFIIEYSRRLNASYVFIPELLEFSQGHLGETHIAMRLYLVRTSDGLIMWDITSSIRERSKDRYSSISKPVNDIRTTLSKIVNVSLNQRTTRSVKKAEGK